MISLEWSDEGRKELFGAYVKAQSEMGSVLKGETNAHFSSKYADLATVIAAVLPAFNKNGLAVIQSPSFDGETVTIETVVAHDSGAFMRSSISMRPTKGDPQGIGSAVTYGRRYSLLALAGVAPEDDDGNAASGPGEPGKRFTSYESALSRKSAAAAKRDGDHETILRELAACQTEAALDIWFQRFDERTAQLPLSWIDPMKDEVEKRRNAILDVLAEQVPA